MAVSLTNANGDPVSLFGSGNTSYAMGQKTNAFEANANPFAYAEDKTKTAPSLLSPRTFSDTANVNEGETTATTAGDTQSMGYTNDPRQAVHGTRSGGTGGAKAAGRAGAKLIPDEEVGLKPAQPGEAPTPAHPDGPTEDEQNEMATRDTEDQMGMPTPWRDGSRSANFGYGRGEANGGSGSSYTNGGSFSSVDEAEQAAQGRGPYSGPPQGGTTTGTGY
jgi:hypothetical protein